MSTPTRPDGSILRDTLPEVRYLTPGLAFARIEEVAENIAAMTPEARAELAGMCNAEAVGIGGRNPDPPAIDEVRAPLFGAIIRAVRRLEKHAASRKATPGPSSPRPGA